MRRKGAMLARRRRYCNPDMAKRRPYEEQNSQEQECDDHPSKEINSDGILFHPSISAVGITDARVGDEQGSK
jgi:hypothetical protein